MVNPFVLAVFLHYGEKRKYSAAPNVKYFRFCENVKYASRMKYSALPNVKYFHFLRKMKMCGWG